MLVSWKFFSLLFWEIGVVLPFREKEERKKEGFLRFPRPFAEGGNVRQKDGGSESRPPPERNSIHLPTTPVPTPDFGVRFFPGG